MCKTVTFLTVDEILVDGSDLSVCLDCFKEILFYFCLLCKGTQFDQCKSEWTVLKSFVYTTA